MILQYNERDYDNINEQIVALRAGNERLQDQYIAKHGFQSDEIYKEHDRLCDTMCELVAKRSEIAECIF